MSRQKKEPMPLPKKIAIIAGSIVAIIVLTIIGITSNFIKLKYIELDNGTYAVCEYYSVAITPASAKLSDTYKGKPVTEIAENGFASGTLKAIEIPSSITKIGKNAFKGCANLTEVVIPDSVTEIGEGAFESCYGLTKVTLPKNIKIINEGAFFGCSSLTEIVIPEGVTEILMSAFESCTSLENITLPSTLEYIDASAFKRCSALKKINLPKSIIEIAKETFSGCTSLNEVTLPSGLQSIGVKAFEKCSSLTSITFPETLKEIEENAFNSSGLTSLNLPNKNVKLGNGAFNSCLGLTEVTIPEKTNKSFGASLFAGCKNLKSVTLLNNPTKLSNLMFSNCAGLTSFEIPASVTEIGSKTFNGCLGLTQMVIPESVKTIGKEAFLKCTGLTSVTLGDGAVTVGESAFTSCSSLENITINQNILAIEVNAFADTKYYNTKENWENGSLYISNCLIETKADVAGDYVIKNGTICIANSALNKRENITSISIPASVKRIGVNAFANLKALTAITVADGNENFLSHDGALYSVEVKEVNKEPVTTVSLLLCPTTKTSLEIVASATKVDTAELSKITAITVADGNQNFFVHDGALYSVEVKEVSGKTTTTVALIFCPANKTTLEIVANATKVDTAVLSKMAELTAITVADGNVNFFAHDGALYSVEVEEDVTTVTLIYCPTTKTSLEIAANVNVIKANVLSGCKKLESITFLGNAEAWAKVETNADKGNQVLEKVTVAD